MAGTEHRYTGHGITATWTTPISGKPSRITCQCGWEYEALPDLAFPDPHEPHSRAYLNHRAKALGRKAKAGVGPGWQRMSLR